MTVVPDHLRRSWVRQRELSLTAYATCGPIARRLYDGGMSLRLVSQELNRQGFRLRRNGNFFSWASVRTLLAMFPESNQDVQP